MNKIDATRFFIFDTIPRMRDLEYNFDFIKFVFKKEDLKKIEKLVLEEKEYDKERCIKAFEILRENSEKVEEDSIIINDYDKFFENISLILSEKNTGILPFELLIRTIWLRMGITDIGDVEGFLKRQLEFIKNDNIIKHIYETFYENENISIQYKNGFNSDCFETNKHINFQMENKGNYYRLPVVHYGIRNNNDNMVCYVYGIQNINENVTCDSVELDNYLKVVKKGLRNKYVSKDFVLVLSMFLDLMYSKGIEEIRVPFFQVFNYKYHVMLSDDLNEAYGSYTDEEKEEYERLYELGNREDKILDYMHDKKQYNKFADKADIISYSKTERFINTFMVVKDLFNSIDIINEPFIEGDELIIKIKKNTDILDKFNNKEYVK